MKDTAIYPGTFDPLTLGHLDLIERAAHIFTRVIAAVVISSRKQTTFTLGERVKMLRDSVKHLRNVEVDAFDGLLVDFARSRDVHVLVRGLRAYSDFEYEFQMALTNRKLAPNIETIFLMPQEAYSTISSSIVREIAERGGDIRQFVPAPATRYVERKLGGRGRRRAGR